MYLNATNCKGSRILLDDQIRCTVNDGPQLAFIVVQF